MCGITGRLNWKTSSSIGRQLLEKMNRSMTSRGPDDEGYFLETFVDPTTGPGSIGLAMRRLAIIDVATGQQPIFNETRDVVVVYNGETYNFQELRQELIAHGHTFKTHSDTEVLVHGYEQWGLDMPSHLNGMFGFALWDKNLNRLILGRDRMGIKPLYYALHQNSIVFGSEIKAILEDATVPRDIDVFALDDYLSFRYVPTPRSIYQSIRKLEPATILVWEKGEISKYSYWSCEPSVGTSWSLKNCLEKTDALLSDAVKRQLVSEVPLGTFLSGGIDSPTITYYAKLHKPDLMTFNIYFDDPTFSERKEAKQVAHHLQTRHIEQEVSPSITNIIPELVDIFDEPFGDDSMIPTYFLTKLARQHMTVALSGDGGDELFGGYPTYLADRAACVYRSLPQALTSHLFEPIINRLPVSFDRLSLDYKAKAFISAARRPSPLEHFGWTEVFRAEHKKQLYSEAIWEYVKSRPLAESFTQAFENAGQRKGLERFLYVDQKTHLLDEFLVKVDRLSMAHSLEVRPPFLDHRLVELAVNIPMRYKIRGITLKYILRRLMKNRLPLSIIKGSKKGFSPPMAKWLSKDLQNYVRRKFSPEHLKDIPFLNPNTPAGFYELHLRKSTNLARRLWTLLMFIEWYDRKVLKRA